MSGQGRARWTVLGLALLAALLPLLTHTALLTGDAVLYRTDAAQLQLPRFQVMHASLRAGQPLATWMTGLYGGFPFHASIENPSLYPPALLLCAVCEPVLAMNLFSVGHLAFAALGAFLLARRLILCVGAELTPGAAAGAAFAAAAFSLNHYMRSEAVNLVIYGAAHAWIPWVLLAADGVLQGARPRRAAGALALALAMQLFTGGLYPAAYTWLAVVAWFTAFGLAAGPEARARALRYGSLAAGVAALIGLAKALPFLALVELTNRAGSLGYAEALSVTLGGHGDFAWAAVGKKAAWYTAAGLIAAPALLAPAASRGRAVLVCAALALFGLAVSLGGPAHSALAIVPPFDRIRGAIRAWTLVNAFLPLLAGFGVAWLVTRVRRLRADGPAAVAGAVLVLAATPLLIHSWRLNDTLRQPDALSDIDANYKHWPFIAERTGKGWRAFNANKDELHGRNEQFIAMRLGVETPAGYLGHLWPTAMAEHLYEADASPMDSARRLRRLAILSVRFVILGLPPHVDQRVDPWFVEGLGVAGNEEARPRALAVGAAVGVVGDADRAWTYALLDREDFPLRDAALIEVGADLALEEAAALAAVLAVGDAPVPQTAAGIRVVRAPSVAPDGPGEEQVRGVLSELFPAPPPASLELGFQRLSARETRISRAGAGAARFAVVSEPWALYPGWTVRADGPLRTGGPAHTDGTELAARRADGVASAVLLPGGASELVAAYAPGEVVVGLLVGALGALLALALVLTPAIDSRRAAPNAD